ncbi:hypothetical protein Tco_0947401 [Tanacetum coccineum]
MKGGGIQPEKNDQLGYNEDQSNKCGNNHERRKMIYLDIERSQALQEILQKSDWWIQPEDGSRRLKDLHNSVCD